MRTRLNVLLIAVSALSWSCSNTDSTTPNLPGIEYDTRVPDVASVQPDLGSDLPTTPSTRVELDLTPYLPEPGSSAVTKAYQLESDDAPFSGMVVAGRTGDWVIENDEIRVLIEGDKRAMSPCPWGGTPVDAAYLAGGSDEDILGEVCMLINGGLSFHPDTFEVLRDGSDGGAAVLAASGDLAINDFLNLPAMVDDFIPGFSERIAVDVNEILPLRVTTYYILAPGETNLRALTAFRNDTDEQVDTLPIFIVASGGDGYYFNPMSSTNGFGAGSAPIGAALDNLPFIAFNGERASYAFAPLPNPDLATNLLPLAGSYLIISGVAATALGASATELLPLLTAGPQAIADNPRVLHVEPHGGVKVLEYRLFVGDGALSSMVDPIYAVDEVTTGVVEGTVRDTDGNPVAGARVTALRKGFRAMNQAISGSDGHFSMSVPPESYELRARRGAWTPDGVTNANVSAGDTVDAGTVGIRAPGVLRVNVTTPDDGCADTTGPQPVPARLTVICVNDCQKATLAEADTKFHGLPDEYQTVVFGGADGVLETDLPAGDYLVLVSRGLEWSVWPSDGLANPYPVTIAPKQLTELDAEIARVLDTGTAYAGDFHVHSISSPDSTVSFPNRVLNYAAEGVDLLVSTDHDYISDHRPYVTDLSLDRWLRAVVGDEVTTADLGHFNAFPLTQDPTKSRYGAVDWGNGADYTLVPKSLYAKINEFPGEQVVQVNHAGGLGLIKLGKADVLRGITYADREKHRLPPQTDPGKTAEDTGFWSDDFTAMELMNGNSLSRFYRLGRWWMQMIGRGFSPTGTAVTDTHKLYADLGGVPRTYVFDNVDASCGDAKFANLADYDAFLARYTTNVNAGRAVGSNGPFMRVWVENETGTRTDLGETATTGGGPFVAHVEIQTAEWVHVDTLQVYMNPPLADVNTGAGELIETPIPATQTIPITWDENTDLITVRTGISEHKAWRKTIDIPLQTSEDAFLVVTVSGSDNMAPVARTSPFAFANPIFIDVDGGGYDHPPYAAAAARPPGPQELPPGPVAIPTEPIKPSELLGLVRELDCKNVDHQH